MKNAPELVEEAVEASVELVTQTGVSNKKLAIIYGAVFAVGVAGTLIVWKIRKARAAAAAEGDERA